MIMSVNWCDKNNNSFFHSEESRGECSPNSKDCIVETEHLRSETPTQYRIVSYRFVQQRTYFVFVSSIHSLEQIEKKARGEYINFPVKCAKLCSLFSLGIRQNCGYIFVFKVILQHASKIGTYFV